MYSSKSLFLLTTMLGTILTMSSNNWISMWMGVELNMLSFIPLMSKTKSKASAEASMIYFLVQSMSSMILMFSVLMMMNESTMNIIFNNILMMSLMIKLGAAPFHMWLPEMMSKISWNNCLLLMTWQKLAPLMMMSNVQINQKTLFMASILSAMIGAVGGLNQSSMRKLMAYSSINHLGWMISINKIQNNWLFYWTIYSIMNALICFTFNKYNIFFINQINMMNLTMTEKFGYITSMLSMGGLPPFIGFLPKWIVIQTLTQDKLYLIPITLIMMSMITLFFYMRTMTSMFLNNMAVNKWNFYNKMTIMPMLMIMFNLSLPMIMV
uniref:NADH-ubiquinone oxidoreductase chain 2 n=1 Tax=Tessaratoma papillosa TaxID=236711 RepID=A0A343W8Z1_9HEMI|nr:NADH dehydrogenase subunit 2 [Tessaratoma papillosa]AVZ00831.1 NADH dehydrogenase subunit 2 [Tessaratoma papillosa]